MLSFVSTVYRVACSNLAQLAAKLVTENRLNSKHLEI